MVKSTKKEEVVKKGISFEKSVLEQLDLYAKEEFSGNSSAAVNKLLGALHAFFKSEVAHKKGAEEEGLLFV